jgi:hypothetical protein
MHKGFPSSTMRLEEVHREIGALRNNSDGLSPASNRGGPSSIPGQIMWDLWWTKWQWSQFLFHQVSHIHLSSGAGTIRQLVPDVPIGLSLTPPHETKKREIGRKMGTLSPPPMLTKVQQHGCLLHCQLRLDAQKNCLQLSSTQSRTKHDM